MKEKQTTKYFIAGLVTLATFMVYLPCLQSDFLQWDDNNYVFENPHIRSLSPDFFKWAFFDFYAGNWHPLTWISHALDYAVWGLNPMGHHLTNNILHAVNTFLVVLLVARLLELWKERTGGEKGPAFPNERGVLIAAATTGLLFGLHPLHVESVAWVSERKDLLCALFFLLSIMAYLKYLTPHILPLDKERGEDGARRTWYFYSIVFFVFALMSKPMAVSLPLVLLILDWYPFGRVRSFSTFQPVFIEKLPFVALSLVSAVLTLQAQGTGGAIKSTEFAPLDTRLLVGAKSLIAYLWKILMPIDLVPFYPYPKEASLASLEYLSAIILAVGITIACIMMARRQKLWLSAWGYYVLTLLPVLGIVQVGLQSMADRYAYLPSLGPFLVIGLTAAWVWARASGAGRHSRTAKAFAVAAAVLVIVALSYATIKQTGVWKNSIVFWSLVIEKEPKRVLMAYLNRGVAYEKTGQINKAIEDYDRAIAIDPLYFEAYNNRGVLYGQEGLFAKAIECFNKSLSINPDYEDAYVNRGIAYALAGQSGRALDDFDRAILLDQNSAKAYVNRGNLYLRIGNRDRARSDFQKACELGNEDGCARGAI